MFQGTLYKSRRFCTSCNIPASPPTIISTAAPINMDTQFSVVKQVAAMIAKTKEKLSPLVHLNRDLVRLLLTIGFSQLND